MRAGHEEAVVAHPRHPAAAVGASVHGHAFADAVALADDQAGFLAAELQVLRNLPDRGEG
jgi:hypothetical protein